MSIYDTYEPPADPPECDACNGTGYIVSCTTPTLLVIEGACVLCDGKGWLGADDIPEDDDHDQALDSMRDNAAEAAWEARGGK